MQPNPRKTKSVLELGPVDITALKQAMLAIPEKVWEHENEEKPNKFEALDLTAHIVFRFVRSLDDWRTFDDAPLWREWEPLLGPVIAKAVAPYGYQNGACPRIMFARMPPGGIIKPHVDGSLSARWPHKIHVPLQTNPKASFFVAPNTYHLQEGQAYEVNNMGPHAVRNDGDEPRTHLIFEYFDRDQPIV